MADYKTQHCVIELLLLLCNTKRDSYCTEKKIATENQWLDYDCASLQNPTNQNATLPHGESTWDPSAWQVSLGRLDLSLHNNLSIALSKSSAWG